MDAPRPPDDTRLVTQLRAGDGAAFTQLVRQHHASMVRVAQTFVSSRSDAEDVVQETWLAVIRGIGAFEGRSSLRTWIFSILINRARTHVTREGRSRAAAMPAQDQEDGSFPTGYFVGRPGRGVWREPVTAWQDDPQLRLASAETLKIIMSAIDDLPPGRRQVLVLRDVEGWSASETAELLGISAANQRVLLHRARNALRLRLERERGR